MNNSLFSTFAIKDEVIKRILQGSIHALQRPHFNIVKLNEHDFSIDILAPGYHQDMISIHQDGSDLVIEAKLTEKKQDFLYQGYQINRLDERIKLPKDANVSGASLKDGILSVHFHVKNREKPSARKITINA